VADVPVDVVGMHGGHPWGPAAAAAVAGADVVVGARRHLDAARAGIGGEAVELAGPLEEALAAAGERRRQGQRVCLLASGDPGFFGVGHRARAVLGDGAVRVHPAPTAVGLAFARIGDRWDDAVVVSAHGRDLGAAVDAAIRHPKVAVMTAPDQPPQALGAALVAAGCGPRAVHVCSRLGEAGEQVVGCDVAGLAGGRFEGLSVVVLRAPGAGQGGAGVRWGRPVADYRHRAGMITKPEVRAVALSKLDLPAAGVVWDVGAGSGSVAVECARLAPGVRVFAVERRREDCDAIAANAADAPVDVVWGEAPAALAGLPDPDRVFVGGGGLAALDAARGRLRPGGRVVATWASLERATAAAGRLGHLVQVAVSRGVPVGGDGSLRLQADNPVFVTWGPE
jgi:precorrin-6Y C5,15-methyltransferase (decarboxylating)